MNINFLEQITEIIKSHLRDGLSSEIAHERITRVIERLNDLYMTDENPSDVWDMVIKEVKRSALDTLETAAKVREENDHHLIGKDGVSVREAEVSDKVRENMEHLFGEDMAISLGINAETIPKSRIECQIGVEFKDDNRTGFTFDAFVMEESIEIIPIRVDDNYNRETISEVCQVDLAYTLTSMADCEKCVAYWAKQMMHDRAWKAQGKRLANSLKKVLMLFNCNNRDNTLTMCEMIETIREND